MPLLVAPPVLAAALPDQPSLLDLIGFQVNGIIVVTIALSLIWGLLELTGFFFRRQQSSATGAPDARRSAESNTLAVEGVTVEIVEPATAAPTTDAPPPHHLAIITAVVHTTFGPQARVASLASRLPGPEWAAEGRRAIFATHKIR